MPNRQNTQNIVFINIKNTLNIVCFLSGGESEIRTRATAYRRTNPLAGGPLIASWVFLLTKRGYETDSFVILT